MTLVGSLAAKPVIGFDAVDGSYGLKADSYTAQGGRQVGSVSRPP